MSRLKEKIGQCLSHIHVSDFEIAIDNVRIPYYNKFVNGVIKMNGKTNGVTVGNRLDFIGESVKAIMANVKPPSTDIGQQCAEIIQNSEVLDDLKRIVLKMEHEKYLISTGFSFVGFIAIMVMITGAGYKCVKYYCDMEIKAMKFVADQVS